jgi:hypothetical protein
MRRIAAVAIVLGSLACATTPARVNYDLDPNYDFAGLQSWDWMKEPGQAGVAGGPSPLVVQRVRAAVERELAAKGYRRVEDGAPDFRVAVHGGTDQKLDVRTTYDYYGYRWRVPVERTDVRQYTEGTLIVDVVDGERNELVWRGTGVAEVRADSPEKITEQVDAVVSEILKNFPSPVG